MPDFTDPAGSLPPGVTADHPVVQFIGGVVEIFMAAENAVQPAPGVLKARVDQLLASRPGPPRILGISAEQQAAQIMALAWESEDEADILAVSALRTWPNCCEAYLLLAMEAAEEVELALMLFTLAVFAGAEALGPAKMEEYAGSFGEHEEALPFLQALAGLARVNLAAGAVEAAAMHLGEVIRLDTADLLGARYELLTILLATGDYANAEALIEAYNEPSAPMAYGLALLAFAREGDSPAAVERLHAARTLNPHVWPYLTGERQLTASGPLDFEFGSEEEALSFAPLIVGAWQAVPGALDWVRGQPGAVPAAAPKPPEKARRSGPREI